jgi:2-oxoglutarate ferredoxin oxidoreductase subunit alpha
MVIAVCNHTDAFYQTVRAFYLARKYQIPVILLSDQYLADSYATVEPYDLSGLKQQDSTSEGWKEEGEYLRYKLTESGISPLLIPGKTRNFVASDSDEHDEFGRITEDALVRTQMMDKRMRKLESLKQELMEPEYVGEEECDTLLVGWGSTYGPIREAVQLLNKDNTHKYGALLFGDIYPLPQKLLTKYCAIAKKVINVEQNFTGQLGRLITAETAIRMDNSILKYDGRQLDAKEIYARVKSEVF